LGDHGGEDRNGCGWDRAGSSKDRWRGGHCDVLDALSVGPLVWELFLRSGFESRSSPAQPPPRSGLVSHWDAQRACRPFDCWLFQDEKIRSRTLILSVPKAVSFRWSPSVVQVAQDDSRCRLRGLSLGNQGSERLVLLFLAPLFEAQTVKNTPRALKMCRSRRLFSFRIAYVEWELLLSLPILCLFVRKSSSSNPRPPITSPPQVYRRVPAVLS
jgi:hypothetical protein